MRRLRHRHGFINPKTFVRTHNFTMKSAESFIQNAPGQTVNNYSFIKIHENVASCGLSWHLQ